MQKEIFECVDKSWLPILDTPELAEILDKVGTNITPPLNQIMTFASYELKNTKIVIIGQDPYPTPGEAHGLAFSCLTGIPASLKAIYNCLINSKEIKDMPKTGNLMFWLSQGVVLLNTALTTIPRSKESHLSHWKNYTDRIIVELAKLNPIFVLWGAHAKGKKNLIKNCTVLEWAHPSPANPTSRFYACDNFTKIREMKININWEPYDPDDVQKQLNLTDKSIVIFTDGACNQNGCGYSWHIATKGCVEPEFITEYGNMSRGTNQIAEGVAILRTLQNIEPNYREYDKIIIVTDSKFWIDMCTSFMPNWDDEKFGKQKNPSLTKPLFDLYKKIKPEFIHVNSHQVNIWHPWSLKSFLVDMNNYVDKLAQKGSEMQQKDTIIQLKE